MKMTDNQNAKYFKILSTRFLFKNQTFTNMELFIGEIGIVLVGF